MSASIYPKLRSKLFSTWTLNTNSADLSRSPSISACLKKGQQTKLFSYLLWNHQFSVNESGLLVIPCKRLCSLPLLQVWSATFYPIYQLFPFSEALTCLLFYLALNKCMSVIGYVFTEPVWLKTSEVKNNLVFLTAFLLCGICFSKRQVISWVRGSSILSSTVLLRVTTQLEPHTHIGTIYRCAIN